FVHWVRRGYGDGVTGESEALPEACLAPTLEALGDRPRSALDRLSLREAVHAVAWLTGQPRSEVYARALALRGEAGD
ncbi:MAG: hypothetical protein ACE5ED_08910, partial [Rhodothalassiaceae bacterium]